jgi:phosphoglycerate dehydrogenase-like enzyme
VPAPRIAVAPHRSGFLVQAVQDGGGELASPGDAEAIVWNDPRDADSLHDLLTADTGGRIRWVQLSWAGVERFAALGMFGDGRTWTSGKGVYAEPVAEHALALGLAGLRHITGYAAERTWTNQEGTSLYEARVTILGAGGITASLIELLAPFRADITVVRREADKAVAGAARTVGLDRLHDTLPGADLVVLALALTPETTGVIGREELALMEPHAWLVNVARGGHVVTDDLVDALRDGTIGGAGLDVTEPEPLPDDSPLWDLPNCVITPHTANTLEMARRPLSTRVRDNVRRWSEGAGLIGLVDPEAGY